MDFTDTLIKSSNIMVLKGVIMNNCDFDNIFDDKFMEDVQRAKQPIKTIYNDIPRIFKDLEQWPKSSNLKCWECSENFYTQPLFLPLNMRTTGVSEDEHEFETHGNFCSWGCLIKYVEEQYKKDKLKELIDLIKIIYRKFTGNIPIKINPAPSKTLMKQYCGNDGLSLEEFKERVNNVKDDVYDKDTAIWKI